jgi:tetratricopeptide (TPR) repeat protein
MPELASLVHKAGCYLMITCQYEDAERFYKLALEISKEIHKINPTEQTELPVANSLNNLAELKEIQSSYQDAKSLFEEALEIRVRCLDEDNYLIGQSKHNLGRLYFHLGKYNKAQELYQEALDINLTNIESVKHGKNNFRKETLNALLARSYNDIAKLYFTQADYDLAEKNYLEAQKINEKRLGKTHPHYASNLDNLGDVYLAQGLSDQAESCYSQALEIRRNYLRGEDFNAIADSYTRLGRLYLVLQDFKKSQDYYEKVLRIRCKIFGEQHPSVANSYNNLALLYQEQNNTTEASKYYAQALKIYHNKKSKYQNHPSLSSLYYNIAIFRHNQEQLVKAEKYYHKSLQLYQSIFGETHPLATNCYYNLSLLYSELERYEDVAKYLVKLGDCEYEIERLDKAAICYSKAIAIYKEELSEQCTLELLDTLDKLALLYQDQGKYKEAESHFQEALQIWQEILEDKDLSMAWNLVNTGVSTPQYRNDEQHILDQIEETLEVRGLEFAYSLDNLAFLYQEQGEYEKALPYFQRALELRQEILGDTDIDTAYSLDNLALLYYEQGEYEQAEKHFKQSLQIKLRFTEPDNLVIADSQDNLAFLYQDQKRYADAETLFQEALELRQQSCGEFSQEVAYSLDCLASLYEQQENYPEAANYLQKSLAILKKPLGSRNPYIRELELRLNRCAESPQQ